MATISAPDLVLLRTTQHRITPKLSVMTPTTLLTARVNNGLITRGARSIAYDGGGGTGFATIEAGHTLWVGTAAGLYDVGTVRIKAIAGNQAAGTITIDENGIDWIDDLFLTVLWNYEIWPVPPYQDQATGIYYKFYTITYTDQNEEPNPVAIAGSHRAGELVGGTLAFTLDGSDSYVVAQGAAITTYLWEVDGPAAAVITNANIATTTITFDTAGIYWVKLTVTDDNGKSQSTYRAYFVHDSSYPPYRNFNITGLNGDWSTGGWSVGLEAFGDVELSDFPDGTLAVLWSTNYFDDAEDYVNLWGVSNEVLCAGYIRQESDGDDLDAGDGGVSFTLVTPEAALAHKSEMGAISIEAVAAPSTWAEYASWLTAGRAVHYLLKWHSTVMETCDVYGLLDNVLGMQVQSFIQESVLAMVNALTFDNGIFARLTSDRLGRLHLVEDSQMFDDTDRAALDTVFTITTADLSGEVNLGRIPVKSVALTFLGGFSFDGATQTSFNFIIPGYPAGAYNQQIPEFDGSGSVQRINQILADQADGEMKTGRVLAAENNPLKEQRVALRGNYLGAFDIVPSIGWYEWGITNATFKRNLSLNGTMWLCRRVEASFPAAGDVYSGDIEVSVILEAEAFGPDGLLADYPTDYPDIPDLPSPNWTPPAPAAPLFDTYLAQDDFEFEDDAINEVVVTRLTDTRAFILYAQDQGGGTLPLYCTTVDWDGVTITQDLAPAEIDSSNCQWLSVGWMDDDHAVCTYEKGGDFYGVVVEIAAGAFNIGAPTLISSGDGHSGIGNMSAISAAYAITAYEDTGGSFTQVIELNGGMQTVTTNTPELIDASATYPIIAQMSTGVALVAYLKSSELRCRTITYVNDTIIAANGETTITTNEPQGGTSDIARIDNTHAIISYIDLDNSSYPTICILTLTSATAVTAAAPVVMNADAAANIARVAVFNSSTAGILYDDSTPKTWLQLIDVLNSPAAASGARVNIFDTPDFADVDFLSATEAVVVYGWVDSANEGIVEIGALS